MRCRWVSLLLGVFLLQGACIDLPQPDPVVDLRVLAAVANPPEVFVEWDAPPADSAALYRVTADPPPVTVTVLVVDPRDPLARVTFSADACIATRRRRCDFAGTGPVIPLARDVSARLPTVTLHFAPTAAQLDAWLAVERFHGFGGLYLLVDLEIVKGNGETVRASRRIAYDVPIVPRATGQAEPELRLPNSNPIMDTFRVDDVAASPGVPIRVERGGVLEVRPTFDLLTFEVYLVPTLVNEDFPESGYLVREETIFWDYHCTAGDFSPNSVGAGGRSVRRFPVETRWFAPSRPGPQTLWATWCDDRGGCGFAELPVIVE